MKPNCEICGSGSHFTQLGHECKILTERDAALLWVEELETMLRTVVDDDKVRREEKKPPRVDTIVDAEKLLEKYTGKQVD